MTKPENPGKLTHSRRTLEFGTHLRRIAGSLVTVLTLIAVLSACANPAGGGENNNNSNNTPVYYTVNYSAGEGTGTVPASRTVLAGTAITLPQKGNLAVTASTERFGGWDNGQRPYAAGASWAVNANVTFTARWMEPLAAAVADYLSNAPGGASAADPVPLPVDINLAGTGWSDLLTAIASKSKSVALDLSACAIAGMTGIAGEFDPDFTNSAGKDKIVSLILPDAATSIKAGTSSDSTFRYFTSLKTVSGGEVTSIGDYAFYYRTALTSVSFPQATNIGDTAFQATGTTALTVTLGAASPTLGSSMFYAVSPAKNVTVKRPSSGAAAYGADVSGGNTSVCWANGFRGAGWNGSAFYSSNSDINQNITVTITDQP